MLKIIIEGSNLPVGLEVLSPLRKKIMNMKCKFNYNGKEEDNTFKHEHRSLINLIYDGGSVKSILTLDVNRKK